jgi:hypothetical protein
VGQVAREVCRLLRAVVLHGWGATLRLIVLLTAMGAVAVLVVATLGR